MKLIKRPSTIKMKRLLLHFIECNVNDRAQLRELQDDARRALAIDEELMPGQRKARPPGAKTRKSLRAGKPSAKRKRSARKRR